MQDSDVQLGPTVTALRQDMPLLIREAVVARNVGHPAVLEVGAGGMGCEKQDCQCRSETDFGPLTFINERFGKLSDPGGRPPEPRMRNLP